MHRLPLPRFTPLAALGALLFWSGCTGAAWLGTSNSDAPSGAEDPKTGEPNTSSGAPPSQLPGSSSTCQPATTTPSLPAAFSRSCSGCHNAFGPSQVGAPDLFQFAGTKEQFLGKVRSGGKGMPAFDAQALSDEELGTIHAYFSAKTPPAPTCTGPVIEGGSCSGVGVPLSPLFESAAAVPAISEKRADGSWVLHGAGRVRGRHENEAEFSLFHPLYFEKRSYEFKLEDSIPAGGKSVTFTWTSIGKGASSPLTNFRYWYTHGGNVFHANVDMVRLSDTQWQYTASYNEREKREIRAGDLLEFEFGVFFDPAAVEGRTNYYTDTFRYRVGSGTLTPLDAPDDAALSGGGLTIPHVVVEPQLSFEQLALNIQPSSVQTFLEGRRLFHTRFDSGEHTDEGNPALPSLANKAGPLVNQTDCSSCHQRNGRGAAPVAGGFSASAVMKVFGSSAGEPHPAYGRQLQDRALGSAQAEGSVSTAFTEQVGAFADGTAFTLRKPRYELKGLAAGPIEHHSVRVARPLVGLGLLEAVADEDLVKRADASDCDKDGVSGRVNVVTSPFTRKATVGRFGWKAGKVSVPHQVADALVADMGVTTSVFPTEECGSAQTGCASGAAPELGNEDLEKLSTYMRLLGVPPRRNTQLAAVKQGEALFAQAGCSKCHAPELRTGMNHPQVELRGQVIHPYSDLLLHDLGPGLADASSQEAGAGAGEWRTPPLWGIGLTQTVSGHTELLHDGRARSLSEAILWHGGEAASARERFVSMSAAERDALLAFLGSL